MLRVNIADTPSKQERGLMFVRKMPHDYGMLFQFPQPRKLSFWGVNTYIPLDIAFVDSNNKIVDIKAIHPLDQRGVSCDKDCPIAIEANIDYFKNNNISVGDTIDLIDDIMEGPCVKFKKISKLAQTSYTEEISVDDAEKIDLPEEDFIIDEYEQEPQFEGSFDERENLEGFQEFPQEEDQLPEYSIEDIGFADDFDEEMEGFDPYDFMDIEKEKNEPKEPEKDFPQFTNAQSAAEWASQAKQTMWIDYNSRSGKNIQRNVEPHGIYKASTGNTVLVTFDETVNDIRAFILEKIKDFQFLDRTFKDKFVFNPK